MSVVEFLLARIGEDEARAHDEFTVWFRSDGIVDIHTSTEPALPPNLAAIGGGSTFAKPNKRKPHLTFRVNANPERVLAECAAKRKIIDEHGPVTAGWGDELDACYCSLEGGATGGEYQAGTWPCTTLRALAAIYADHPDYDEAWSIA